MSERIDLHVEVPRQTEQLLSHGIVRSESSAHEREQVAASRASPLSANARHLIWQALDRLGLSARGYRKVLKLALTIAEMAEAEIIAEDHIAEAISYRILVRRGAAR